VAEAAVRHPGSLVSTGNGKYRFDLPAFVRADLARAGVDSALIDVSGLCTSCTDGLFFSHRRDGAPGRACAFAGIRP
jgi:copper oxidase (laccase) domain-containing protein